MNFTELEKIMLAKGVGTLAEIARALETTPQAVSNWKGRDQVPHHVVAKINNAENSQNVNQLIKSNNQSDYGSIRISDIFLKMAEQLKVIVLVTIISIFTVFTYVQFIQVPKFVSTATILLPETKGGNLGGLAGLASQFGVNVPSGMQADLSSPSLFPELIKSRTFAEKILVKNFYTNRFEKELSLLAILTYGNNKPEFEEDTLVTIALNSLRKILTFNQSRSSTFSTVSVSTSEPNFSRDLAVVVLDELEKLNRYYKSQTVSEKITFIDNRINSVGSDLEASEIMLKEFNEKNRQATSPSLQLEQDRLNREIEVQKGVYLSLKQQLELAKIEEIQETSILQILDKPTTPLYPINKNLKLSVVLSAVLGLLLGILFALLRSYLNYNKNMDERRKLRRIKNFIRKKGKDFIFDQRVMLTMVIMLTMGLPLYLGYQSKNPVFFGRYSMKLMIVNSAYVLALIFVIIMFFASKKRSKMTKTKG